MLQVTQINFCLLHAHLVTKYMLPILGTWSVICCLKKHDGRREKLLYFNVSYILNTKTKTNGWVEFSYSAFSFNDQYIL